MLRSDPKFCTELHIDIRFTPNPLKTLILFIFDDQKSNNNNDNNDNKSNRSAAVATALTIEQIGGNGDSPYNTAAD